LRDELEIRIKWNRNYQFWKALNTEPDGFSRLFVAIAALINRTIIEVRSGYIKIDHGPIDILPMTFYSSRIIKQLQVEPIGFKFRAKFKSWVVCTADFGKKVLLLWNYKKNDFAVY
jgi:hypothetical protein